uniref:Transglutaminase-like domain-containing protein n=1 Tax=Panagrolaimus superbus TaxID=310955 RepID=A0A914Z2S0_9BILA
MSINFSVYLSLLSYFHSQKQPLTLNFPLVKLTYTSPFRNTKYAIDFIQDWISLEDNFIRNYGVNDQAAIHQTFLNRFYSNYPRKKKCERIWTNSDYNTIEGHTRFVACARSVLNDTLEFDRIIIYPKGSHKAWVRDVWLTGSEWAPRDFMLHDMEEWKISNDPEQLKRDHLYFANPFIAEAVFHSTLCIFPNGLKCWKYNSTFIKSNKLIDRKIKNIADKIRLEYLEIVKTL